MLLTNLVASLIVLIEPASAAALTTVIPCPPVPTLAPPITVTSQYQEVLTCTSSVTCHRRRCSPVFSLQTSTYVSTVIPSFNETDVSSTTITRIDQPVTISKTSTVLTTIAPKTITKGYFGFSRIHTIYSTQYTTVLKHWSVPFQDLGPLAIPKYEGSGICNNCLDAEGNTVQILTVNECHHSRDRVRCIETSEVWILPAAGQIYTTATISASSSSSSSSSPTLVPISTSLLSTTFTTSETATPSFNSDVQPISQSTSLSTTSLISSIGSSDAFIISDILRSTETSTTSLSSVITDPVPLSTITTVSGLSADISLASSTTTTSTMTVIGTSTRATTTTTTSSTTPTSSITTVISTSTNTTKTSTTHQSTTIRPFTNSVSRSIVTTAKSSSSSTTLSILSFIPSASTSFVSDATTSTTFSSDTSSTASPLTTLTTSTTTTFTNTTPASCSITGQSVFNLKASTPGNFVDGLWAGYEDLGVGYGSIVFDRYSALDSISLYIGENSTLVDASTGYIFSNYYESDPAFFLLETQQDINFDGFDVFNCSLGVDCSLNCDVAGSTVLQICGGTQVLLIDDHFDTNSRDSCYPVSVFAYPALTTTTTTTTSTSSTTATLTTTPTSCNMTGQSVFNLRAVSPSDTVDGLYAGYDSPGDTEGYIVLNVANATDSYSLYINNNSMLVDAASGNIATHGDGYPSLIRFQTQEEINAASKNPTLTCSLGTDCSLNCDVAAGNLVFQTCADGQTLLVDGKIDKGINNACYPASLFASPAIAT